MRKGFRELSKRQKNRRLRILERQEEHALIAEFPSHPSVAGTNITLHDGHTPTENFVAINNNSDNTANVLGNILALETQGIAEYESEENFLEDKDGNQELSSWLCLWKCKHNISHDAMSELLNKLRKHGHADLPKDARTLLRTPRKSIVKISIHGDSNFHYGLKRAIIDQLSRTKCEIENNVDVLKFGPLDDFSAFPFENYLQTMKKMLKKAEKQSSRAIVQ